jgi:D-3-phosphoglycerate dehydrogenase
VKTGLKEDELLKIIAAYDAMVVRSATKVTAKIIEAADKMKVIGRAGSGVDNIDAKAATKKGIVVMNTPGANTISTAEHTFAMLISLSRNIPQAYESIRGSKWDRKKYEGVELRGKILGIVGLGNIGKALADRARAFDMKVIGFDPFISEEVAAQKKIQLVTLEELIRTSDYISFHTPLSPETKHIINAESIKKCKKGVRIINCARGGIVDEQALVAGIEQGIVAGAAFDVFEKEPPDFTSPLFKNDKIIFTPHLGASTEEAQEMVALVVAEQMSDALLGKGIRNAVNAPSIAAKEMEELRSFLLLGETLGSLQYQMAEGQMKELKINYQGSFNNIRTDAITLSILKGLLYKTTSKVVNEVNAKSMADEKGLKVSETFSDSAGDYVHAILVNYITSKNEHCVEGTVFGKNDIRIVAVDNFRLNAVAEGNGFLYTNDDHPGMIASVTTVMAKNKINIGSMFLAREAKGGMAMCLVNVDSPLQDDVLQSIRQITGIHEVKALQFS